MMTEFRRLLPAALILLVAVSWAYFQTRSPRSAVDFEDNLTGPDSPHLSIPFHAYAFTPAGLERTDAEGDRKVTNDRPIVNTRSRFLNRDFVFDISITIPETTEDLAFIGFGRGVPDPTFSEPSDAVLVRVHQIGDNNDVGATVATPRYTGAVGNDTRFRKHLGSYQAGQRMPIRIERVGDLITLSLPGQTDAQVSVSLAAYPFVTTPDSGFLFFGNSSEGTVFSHIRLSQPVADVPIR